MMNGSQSRQGKRGVHRAASRETANAGAQTGTPEAVRAISVSSANDSDTQGGPLTDMTNTEIIFKGFQVVTFVAMFGAAIMCVAVCFVG
jgi:hypothetical protein